MSASALGDAAVGSGFTPTQELALHTVSGVGAGVSFAASAFVALSYVIFPNLRSATYRLVCLMALCDMCHSYAYYIGYGGGHEWCVTQAVVMQLFGVASMLWSGVFGFHLVVVLVWKDPNESRYFARYHAVVWGVALLLLTVDAAGGVLGGDGALWCWIGGAHSSYRFGTYYGPMLLLFVVQCVCFVSVSQSLALAGDSSAATVSRRLVLYVLCYGVRFWGLLNRATRRTRRSRCWGCTHCTRSSARSRACATPWCTARTSAFAITTVWCVPPTHTVSWRWKTDSPLPRRLRARPISCCRRCPPLTQRPSVWRCIRMPIARTTADARRALLCVL